MPTAGLARAAELYSPARVSRPRAGARHVLGVAFYRIRAALLTQLLWPGGRMVEYTGATEARVQGVEESVTRLTARIEVLERFRSHTEVRASSLENLQAVEAVSRFILHAPLRTNPLVSVVLPTYNRPEFLRQAVESDRTQPYPRGS